MASARWPSTTVAPSRVSSRPGSRAKGPNLWVCGCTGRRYREAKRGGSGFNDENARWPAKCTATPIVPTPDDDSQRHRLSGEDPEDVAARELVPISNILEIALAQYMAKVDEIIIALKDCVDKANTTGTAANPAALRLPA